MMNLLKFLLTLQFITLATIANAGTTQGTGVYINPYGHVITNRHVVQKGCSQIILEDVNGSRIPASILQISPTHDLAVLQSSTNGQSHAYFRSSDKLNIVSDPELDELVNIFGFPEGEIGPRGGSVIVLSDTKHGSDGYTIGLSTTFGASGSPVFDNHGLLIGIVWGGINSMKHVKAHALKPSAIIRQLSGIPIATSTSEQAPVKRTPGLSYIKQVEKVISHGATVTVKVLCLNN